jgi:BirA family biotin operon repressor/biotin-[acetyl-CoA-carboxylase] ligase
MIDATLVRTHPFVKKVHCLDTVDSTNTYAKQQVERPSEGMVVVVAERQSAGRGQRGNTFFSDVAGGLWVSLVLPKDEVRVHFEVNRALALAIAAAVKAASATCSIAIKWPNDICCNGKKLGGMLLEAVSGTSGTMVAGFGLNVNIAEEQFPAEVRSIATSLLAETGRTYGLDSLLHDILTEYAAMRATDASVLHQTYLQSLVGLGWTAAIGAHRGTFETVFQSGEACLRVDGVERRFSSGPMRFDDPRAAGTYCMEQDR